MPWLPVFMGAGIVLFFSRPAEPPAWIAAAFVLLVMPLVVLLWRRQVGRAAALCLLAIAIGFASASLRTRAMPPMAELPRGAVAVSGIIMAVEPLPVGRRVILGRVTLGGGAMMARGLRLRLRDTDLQPLSPGARLSVRALLRPPFAPAYPHAWDQRRDEFYQRLAGGGFALGAAHCSAAAGHPGVVQRWQRFREAVAARIAAVVPGPPGAVAATLLTGISTAIPAAVRADFATAGLAHILAVAGLHIGIVMSTVFAASRASPSCPVEPGGAAAGRSRRSRHLTAIAVGGGYMALTGHPSARSSAASSMACTGDPWPRAGASGAVVARARPRRRPC